MTDDGIVFSESKVSKAASRILTDDFLERSKYTGLGSALINIKVTVTPAQVRVFVGCNNPVLFHNLCTYRNMQ